MNNDGFGQVGAGQNDLRVAGKDLEHYVQPRTADENPTGRHRIVRASSNDGGPMNHELDKETKRHVESKEMRLKHLQEHYKR